MTTLDRQWRVARRDPAAASRRPNDEGQDGRRPFRPETMPPIARLSDREEVGRALLMAH